MMRPRARMPRRVARIAVTLACWSVQLSAQSDMALAETLFREGKKLMADQDFAAACPKLAESFRLDAAAGTLLALAACHERQGKTATAWSEYTTVLAMATQAGQAERQKVARERIAQLEPQLIKLSVRVSPEAERLEGLVVSRDGVELGRAAWGVPSPVDPGEHVIEARARGHRPFSGKVAIALDQPTVVFTIPALEPEPAPAPSASHSASATPPPPPPPAASSTPAPQPSAAPEPRPSVVPGVVVTSAGVLLLGVGAYFGLSAASKSSDANERCPEKRCRDEGALTLSRDANTHANVANVTIGLGAVLSGVGGYLLYRSLSAPAPRAGLTVTPEIGLSSQTLHLRGAW